jgi:hypothetical protein
MKPSLFILPLSLCAAGACEFGQLCDLRALPGVVVTIVDSVTASPVPAEVTVIATHGPYADTAIVAPSGVPPAEAWLAEERPGFYRVEVRAPGYRTWTSPLLHVMQDDCHVRTVKVTARLQPQS